jgi:hypothetical protein
MEENASLGCLSDVDINRPLSGDVLVYDGCDWKNQQVPCPVIVKDSDQKTNDVVKLTICDDST